MADNYLPENQSVLRLKDNQYKIVYCSLHRIISAFNFSNYIIYSVTKEEFDRLQRLSEDNISSGAFNHTPLLINNVNLKRARVLSPTGEEMYLVNNELVEQTDNEFTSPSNYDEIFYTVENYEDILSTYNKKRNKGRTIKLVKKQN